MGDLGSNSAFNAGSGREKSAFIFVVSRSDVLPRHTGSGESRAFPCSSLCSDRPATRSKPSRY